MKKIDLSILKTEDLHSLADQIQNELKKRRGTVRHNRKMLKRSSAIHEIEALSRVNENQPTSLLTLPRRRTLELIYEFEPYLPPLINQDWNSVYPRDTEEGEYYVYAHIDPRKKPFITTEDAGGNYGGMPFYIGKGIGSRAFQLKRNEGHGKTIREIIKNNWPKSSIVNILFKNLSEQKAFEIEAKLIYFFGTQFSMIRPGPLVNLDQPTIPKFIGSMKKIKAKPPNIDNEPEPQKEPIKPPSQPKIQKPIEEPKPVKTPPNMDDIEIEEKMYTYREAKEIINRAIRKRLERIKH